MNQFLHFGFYQDSPSAKGEANAPAGYEG